MLTLIFDDSPSLPPGVPGEAGYPQGLYPDTQIVWPLK
jgi:hypothetical protein